MPSKETSGSGDADAGSRKSSRRFGGLSPAQLVIAGTLACGNPGDHAHWGADGGRDGGSDGIATPLVRAPSHRAEAAEISYHARVRIILVLAEPENWDGSVMAVDPDRPEPPLIVVGQEGREVNPGAVETFMEGERGAVVLTLVAPEDTEIKVKVQMGRSDNSVPDQWKLILRTSVSGSAMPIQTYGGGGPIEPLGERLITLRRATDFSPLPPGMSRAPFGGPQWIEGGLRPAVVRTVTNRTKASQRVRINAAPASRLIVDGEMLPAGGVVELPPGRTVGVVAYPDPDGAACTDAEFSVEENPPEDFPPE